MNILDNKKDINFDCIIPSEVAALAYMSSKQMDYCMEKENNWIRQRVKIHELISNQITMNVATFALAIQGKLNDKIEVIKFNNKLYVRLGTPYVIIASLKGLKSIVVNYIDIDIV